MIIVRPLVAALALVLGLSFLSAAPPTAKERPAVVANPPPPPKHLC